MSRFARKLSTATTFLLALLSILASAIAPPVFAQVSPGSSPLAVVKGGTGSATAAGARSNLQVDKFTGHGDSAYAIVPSDRVVGTNANFTASRTWTLPAANAVNAGQALIIADFQGTVTASNTLVIARAGSDTVNGGTDVTIDTANGAFLLWSDGSSKWTAQAIGASSVSGVSSLDGATGAISTQPGSLDVVGSTLSSNVLSSRTFAATQDLSTFSAVRTLGYAAAGDGGGATFKNVGSAAFIDSNVSTGSVTAGGTCSTNGTFYGVAPAGGTGVKLQGIVVIAGGIMTSFTPTGPKGNAYTVSDILTIPNGSYNGSTLTCSVSPTWTVSAVTTSTASFTDSVGNHWQYVVDAGNFPNTRQFGAKLDRAGKANDGLATDDGVGTQNALNFAGYGISYVDNGGFSGNEVVVPPGTSLICNGLVIPHSVVLRGVSNSGTTLKQCDADGNTQNFITLGDPQNHQTAHFVGIQHMTLFGANAGISGTVAMVYSNSANSDHAVVDVSIYPIYRACVFTETGYGGPGIFRISGMYCVPNSSVTPFGVSLNGASNQVIDGGTWFSAGGSPWGQSAILVVTNGPSVVNEFLDVHCENLAICARVNVPAGGNGTMTYIRGMIGNATVTDLIQRVSGSASGQLAVEFTGANGSNCTVRNAGTCSATGNIFARTTY